MNKTLLPALFSLLTASAAFGQAPTLTAANMNPVLNDSFLSVICDTATITAGAAGTSVTWNFTGLTASTTVAPNTGVGYVVYAHSAPGYTTLSLLPSFAASTHAIISPATAIAAPPDTTITNYYIEGSSSTSQTGTWVNSNNYAAYSDPIDVLHFPFTLSSSFTDSYAGLVTYTALSTTVSATEGGTVTVNADGWGTLNLPFGASYTSVLRVHSYQLYRDSANLFGTPTITTDTLETYAWYKPGYHSALLSIATLRTPYPAFNYKTVAYVKSQLANHENVPDINSIDASLAICPNPASNALNISFNTPTSQLVYISLYDMAGQEVAVLANKTFQGKQNLSFNTDAFPRGLYVVHLQSGNGSVTRKIELQ
jgi:hypothetical protein